MPNLLELDSLTRYRLFMAIGSILMLVNAGARILAEDPSDNATRFVVAGGMGAFALFAARVSWVSRNHHAWALFCLLPLTLHMSSMTYTTNLSHEIAIANLVVLTMICCVVDNRRWLNMQVTVWCTCVISVAWTLKNPIFSPMTYSALMIITAVFIGLLFISFYESQDLLRRKITELDESQEFAQVGTWEVDMRTHQVTWSNSTYQIMKVDIDSSQLSFEQVLTDIPENEEFAEQIKSFFTDSDTYDAIGQVRTGAGTNLWVHSRGTTFLSVANRQES